MNAGPRLQTGLSQRLALAPRQSEALRLLALPTLDLEQMLETALEENAMLERLEPEGSETREFGESEGEYDTEAADGDEDWGRLEWSSATGGGERPDEDTFEDIRPPDLRQHLVEQLDLERISERDYRIAVALIDALDANGYLGETPEAITKELEGLDPAPGTEEVEAILHRLQHLDPVGVGARDAAECLLLQLGALPPETPALDIARMLLEEHRERLPRADLATLARLTHSDPDVVRSALALIQGLNPRPGSDYSAEATQYLIPELQARRTPGGWQVELYPGTRPHLAVNETYAAWLGSHRREEGAETLSQQLEEARWLIRSLAQRDETLLRVARVLVRRQSEFLDHGALHFAPLTLRDVAEELDLHESTVSRAVQGKAMATPRGVITLRHLFSNTVSNDSEQGVSARAVQERLRHLLNHEDPTAPLSDAALAKALAEENMPVARRTVAKYREAMGFASTRERKRPAHSAASNKG